MYDIAVIGGGINGCGIARDAAGRGFKTFLAEKNDLASGTSSGATKLVHGGLRYLEHYEFRLVRESLRERERLWAAAPHIIRPMRFILPHHDELRPAWLLRLGLFIYDHIGGRKKLPATRVLNLHSDPAGTPLKADYKKAFEYSDCWADDARLVVLNARDAARRGADVRTRCEVTHARRNGDHWLLTVKNTQNGSTEETAAKLLINAAGPWTDHVIRATGTDSKPDNIRLVQGSHIVIRRKLTDDRAYIFQNADERILFAIPYEQHFTMLGTTDRDYDGDIDDVRISDGEMTYLCEAASEYFKEPVTRDEIAWTFSANRPLYNDGASQAQEATRDYILKVDSEAGQPPLLNVFGGKLTTFRRLAESALEIVEEKLGPRQPAWTAATTLPGGDFPADGLGELERKFAADFPFLEASAAERLVHCYGMEAWDVAGDAKRPEDFGHHFGATLTEREVSHLTGREWARTADDILWRRTKQGLHMTEDERLEFAAWYEAG